MTVDLIAVWILVGAATGLLSSLLLSHSPAGVLGAIIIGVVGAVVAGLVFSVLDLPISAGILTNAGVAFAGSVIFVGLSHKLMA